ncbi:hypothetical protein, partial [Pectobacterium carotovorum]
NELENSLINDNSDTNSLLKEIDFYNNLSIGDLKYLTLSNDENKQPPHDIEAYEKYFMNCILSHRECLIKNINGIITQTKKSVPPPSRLSKK